MRKLIISEMRGKETQDNNMGLTGHGYATWWFKFEMPFKTIEIRKELLKMEREGLVKADRSQRNNTKWFLTEAKQSD